jgi:membrane protease subunit (stomatin/prohibitin family)
MALLGREFIAVPDDRKGQIVFKWPDNNIRRFSRAIVDADELALFVNKGEVIGTLSPGQHQIDADELPFLGAIVDHLTGGKAYRAELFFVGTREYTDQTFGGRVDDVQDPQTGMIVTLRVFGNYSLKVADAAKLVTNLTGTVDVTDNDAITSWIAQQLLKVMRTEVTTEIVRNGWPILGLSAYTPQLEQTVLASGNAQLVDYGLSLVRMGNFDVNLSDDDEAQLKALAKDTAYSRLAGGFQQYASGEAMLGAGQGMARGGAGTGPAFIATGMGVGQQVTQPPSSPPPPSGPGFVGGGPGFAGPPGGAPGQPGAQAPAAAACPSCGAGVPAEAKFCPSCGSSLAPSTVACAACGVENAQGSKFCSSCGASLAAAAPSASKAPEDASGPAGGSRAGGDGAGADGGGSSSGSRSES